MTSSSEKKAAYKFLMSNPSNLKTALAVYESWPCVRDDICEKFLKRLRSRIDTAVKENEKLKEFAGDRRVGYKYGSERYKSGIWLYRACWARYPNPRGEPDGRTAIYLGNQIEGPKNWNIGVSSPMSKTAVQGEDEKRRQSLVIDLECKLGREKSDDWWPWYVKVNEDKGNWNSLVPALYQENKEQGGEITSYFVDKFTEIAEKAIPIINDIEG